MLNFNPMNQLERDFKFAVILGMIVAFLLGFMVGVKVHRFQAGDDAIRDTVTVVDTVRCHIGEVRDSVVVRYTTQKLPIVEERNFKFPTHTIGSVYTYCADSILRNRADSIKVRIPIVSKKYEDSLYTAYVSGYNPRLDSIFIYPRRITIRDRPTHVRWNRFGVGVGVGVGYGVTSKKFEPFVGVTFHYNFLSF